MKQNGRTVLTTGEVTKIFMVSSRTVRVWTREGRLPCFFTLGGHRRFYLDVIEKAIKDMLEREAQKLENARKMGKP